MRILIAVTAVLALSALGFSQEPKKIKKVEIGYTNPTSGAEMFRSYCAACHGTDGKGTGPAASVLNKAPADLTLLTKKSDNGKFPYLEVENTIKGDLSPAAHGSRDMPMWGDLFRSVSAGPAVVQIRVRNLRDYIESMQEK